MEGELPRRLRIVSDGTVHGTRLLTEKGEEIQGFNRMRIEIDARPDVWVHLVVYGCHLDIKAEDVLTHQAVRIESEGKPGYGSVKTEDGELLSDVKSLVLTFDASDLRDKVFVEMERL